MCVCVLLQVLRKAGARIDETNEDADLSPEERARMLKWKEQTNMMKAEQDGKGPGGKWSVVKKNPGSSPPAPSSGAKNYSPPEDGYTLMPPGGIPDKPGASGGAGGEGIKRAAGLDRQQPPTKPPAAEPGSSAGTTTLKRRASSEPPPDNDGPPAAKGSVGTTTITRRAGSEPPPAKKGPPAAKASAVEAQPVVKRSRGRPRKDGTPAQPKAKTAAPAEGGPGSPPKKSGGAKKKVDDSEDSKED